MVVFAPAAAADSTLAFCDLVTPAPPCVVSVQKNGLDIPYNAAPGGADDVVYATKFHITGDPTKHFYFNIAAPDGSWTVSGGEHTTWDTCFAILFLKKATKPLVASTDAKR